MITQLRLLVLITVPSCLVSDLELGLGFRRIDGVWTGWVIACLALALVVLLLEFMSDKLDPVAVLNTIIVPST